MEAKYTMTTKYIIECPYKLYGEVRPAYFRHHLLRVNEFTYKKAKAQRFCTEQEAQQAIELIKTGHGYGNLYDTFYVIPVRGRVYKEVI